MRGRVLFWMLALLVLTTVLPSEARSTEFTMRKVTSGMWVPWEMRWGPDQMIWTTERNGVVSRVHPETGERTMLLDHSEQTGDYGEGGMLGLCHHPDFPDSPYVYVTVNYAENWRASYRTLERWTYDSLTQKLTDRRELRRFSPTAWAHQGGRLAFGLDRKLYMTTGENADTPWESQSDTSSLGKVLRFNADGSIPADNPLPGNPMWCKGLRNPQGLLVMDDGRILTSEHGNTIEDEINLIQKGANYGWPEVEGPCDEPWEQAFCDSVGPVDPFFSSGTVTTWAMSDMAYYNHDRFPMMKNAILLATLRHNSLYVLHLNEARDQVDSVTRLLRYSVGRFRDIAVTPDGRIFLSTSNNGDLYTVDPFPIENDDHIYELQLLPPGSPTTLEGPSDTLQVVSYEKEHIFLTATVTNTGTTPTTITDIQQVTPGPLDDSHWNQPFIIMPGVPYTINLQYRPWDFGVHEGHVRLISDNSNNVDIYLKGLSFQSRSHPFTLRPIAPDLERPYEIQWAPDGTLWTTESHGIVRRINPDSQMSSMILDLRSEVDPTSEGGLTGLALHPSFADSPYVFLAVTRRADPGGAYRSIERWRYDRSADALSDRQEILRLDSVDESDQGCRLTIDADGALLISTADKRSAGTQAQDPDSPFGKILRIRLDGSVPDNNPTTGSPVWSVGFRDPQGLTVLPDGSVFSSEIGEGGDDEINIVERGANYGWPAVKGPCDDPSEQEFCDSVQPVDPFHHSGTDAPEGFSDLDFYTHDRYPELTNSILLATLDRSALLRLTLTEDRSAVASTTRWFTQGVGRIRDVEISPDGRVFVCTSNRGAQVQAPFPLDGDDHLYELVPVGTDAYGVLSSGDTITTEGTVSWVQRLEAAVTNIGTAPAQVTDLEPLPVELPFVPVEPQPPFVIMPGITYPIELVYQPFSAGMHEGVIRVHTDNALGTDVHLRGTATVSSVDEGRDDEGLVVIPQPFTTSVRITLPANLRSAKVRVLDLSGQEVWSGRAEGSTTMVWPGSNTLGMSVAPGTYVVMATDGYTTLRTLIVRIQP